MPRRMRARVSMEQEDWRAGSAVAHPQLSLADVDPLEREAVEHGPKPSTDGDGRLWHSPKELLLIQQREQLVADQPVRAGDQRAPGDSHLWLLKRGSRRYGVFPAGCAHAFVELRA